MRHWVDPYSSGAWFTGWDGKLCGEARVLARERKPAADAQTWLLAIGWKEHWGPIRVDEVA